LDELNTGDKVKIVKVGVQHLFNLVGDEGKIVSSLVKSEGDPRRYKVLFDIHGIVQTAYFLGNEIVKI